MADEPFPTWTQDAHTFRRVQSGLEGARGSHLIVAGTRGDRPRGYLQARCYSHCDPECTRTSIDLRSHGLEFMRDIHCRSMMCYGCCWLWYIVSTILTYTPLVRVSKRFVRPKQKRQAIGPQIWAHSSSAGPFEILQDCVSSDHWIEMPHHSQVYYSVPPHRE